MTNHRLNPPPISYRLFSLVFVAALVVSLASCVQGQKSQIRSTQPLDKAESPKMSQFVYYEQGKELFIGVDGRAAMYIKQESMFPLGLGLANTGKSGITVTKESFVLETASGERYPPVSYQEYTRDYNRSRADVKLSDSFLEMLNLRFATYTFLPWRPFPAAGQPSTVLNQIELGRLIWTHGYVYFPVPEDGIHDRSFALLVTPSEGSEDTFIVRFKLK